MKYLRSYPWGMQLLLFFLMIFTMGSFGYFLVYTIISRFTPFSLEQISAITEHSPAAVVKIAIIVQGIVSLFVFLIPAWLFSYLTHPNLKEYLGLRKPGKNVQILLSVLLMLGAMPMLQLMENLIGLINFSAKIKEDQAASQAMMNAFLTIPDLQAFIRGFLVMAIIPAIGEELFFRGVLMRFSRKRSRNMIFPIIFTSVIFAWSHTNIYGLLSIFTAGVLLAVIYNLTGSIWCGIAGHMAFNGTQVVLSYIGNSSAGVKAFMNSNTVPYYYVMAGAILFSVSLYLLLKNKTPLPANWTDDFPNQTPKDTEWDFMRKN